MVTEVYLKVVCSCDFISVTNQQQICPAVITTTASPLATTTKSQLSCSISAVDLVFVLDQSGSVGINNYCLCLQFIAEMTQSILIGPNVTVFVFFDGYFIQLLF
jgi:hypothetical protein